MSWIERVKSHLAGVNQPDGHQYPGPDGLEPPVDEETSLIRVPRRSRV